MNVLIGITIFLGLVILAALVIGAYNVALGLWDKTAETRRDVSLKGLEVDRGRLGLDRQKLDLDRERLRVTERIYPDSNGVYPLLFDGHEALDVNRGVVFSIQHGVQVLTEALARPEQLARLLRAAGGWPTGNADKLLTEPERGEVWPGADLVHLFGNRTPTIHDLVIGVTHSKDVISASLHDLMHVLNVGASGWGKSTWLRALLWQIALAGEPIEVIAIDISGSEFNVLRDWSKLRYPVARTTADAIALLAEVTEEIARRGELYEEHPLATKLVEFNRVSGENLPPWVVVIDEGTNLLNQTGIGDPLRATIQTARQYGVYVLLAGQSAKHSVIDTQVRDNFSTRLCFRTSPSSSQVVLDSRVAGNLTAKGRAYVQLVGRELLEVQGPFISRDGFYKAVANGGPKRAMPEAPEGTGIDDRARRILELHDQGESDTAIAFEVYGHGNTFYIRKVREILQQQQHQGQQPAA